MEATLRRFLLAVHWTAALCAPTLAQPSLTVERTEFVLRMPDGRTLRSQDLLGATLQLGPENGKISITIKGVDIVRTSAREPLFLHRLTMPAADGTTQNLCAPDAAGQALGFPVPDGDGGFTLACTSGAVGKCILWGYQPWADELSGPQAKSLHRACVHAARADYGGDGVSHTRDGTRIDLCDRFGKLPCDRVRGRELEAAWDAHGAVCVARPRIRGMVSVRRLARRYPQLKSRLGAKICTMAIARREGAAVLYTFLVR